MAKGIVPIKEFDYCGEPLQFKLGDEVFYAAPDLPKGALELSIGLSRLNLSSDEGLQPFLDFLEEVLLDDSARRIIERFNSKERTIGIRTMHAITMWLLEEYGLRPTQPSLPSSNASSGSDGTSSTDGASHAESIL
ncbi:MAG: hypothetical protein A2Y75_05385 [Candidatus Solincola sediminis]|uniref:Uncharacterized protein n=1 Tax=Candidatus Solincola sediminis TaxID=1797199 RepID=A0A1F2WG55_9ACTN|nr:MAG: hypothetical protein A2Y75_05385 [Candidatus Solincola sediminis]